MLLQNTYGLSSSEPRLPFSPRASLSLIGHDGWSHNSWKMMEFSCPGPGVCLFICEIFPFTLLKKTKAEQFPQLLCPKDFSLSSWHVCLISILLSQLKCHSHLVQSGFHSFAFFSLPNYFLHGNNDF